VNAILLKIYKKKKKLILKLEKNVSVI